MALSFDHLMRSGGNRSAATATTERTSGPLSFDNLPKVTYASDDDGVRGKIARGMVSRIFSDENENRKVLEAAKAQRVNPTRILDNISQTRASQLPSDINYKALDPLNILNEEQSLNRFLSAKDKKPLAGRSFNNEAEGIFENFEESSIAAAVDRLRASYPDAGFDQKRPSQVIADARRRLYPELSPFDFAKQLGAVPRGAEGKPFVEEKGKPLSFASALKEALASGATSILSGGVQGYADLTGNQALSDEARTVTRQGKIAQQDAMEGRSGAGEIAVSLANSLPIMAATYATGGIAGSGVGLGTLAAGATAQKYGSNREEGYAPERAFENAALTGLAEAAPEALPLGGFLKAAAPGVRATVGRIAKQAFEEGVSEGITTVGESVADSAVLGKKIDANELLSNVGKSATVGAVMGAGFGAAAGFRDRIRQRVSTGDQATDEGAALAKEIFQQKLDLAAKEAPVTKPTMPMQQEQAVADSNQDIDRYLVRQAQAAFDRTAGEELNALRSAEGRDDVQLGQERVSALAAQVADDWGVSVDQLLDIKPAASSKPFKDIAQNLGTTPEDMLASSQSNQDVVPQPAQEADVVGAGPSQIHGQGLITQQPLGPSDGITLAQGANRTEAGQVVNHSNSPNTTVQIDTADAASPTAIAVPNRRIGAGEELTINYETEIPKIRQSLIDAPRETISLSNSKTLGNIDDQAQAVQSPDRVRNTEFGVGNDIAQNSVPRMGGIARSGSLVQAGAQDQAIVDTANQQSPEVPLAASAAQPTQAAVDPLEQLRIENQRLRDEADSFRREARTQEITGLPNRRQFEFDSTGSAPGAVAAIDMDGLKALNDSVGHKAADAVLAKLGERLRSVETAGGKAYHLSGDEFAVAFQDPEAAQSVMAELQDALDNVEVVLDTPSGQYVYRGIGVSFGIGNDYATADESAKADKQRRLASGKREPARATDGGQVATPRRLVPIAAGGNVSDLARRDIQGPSNGQVGQVDTRAWVATPQTTQVPSASTNRVRMTRDQVRSEVAKNLGGNVASKLERQPWFNVVESVEDLPEAALKSLDDAQNTQGFVTPDGNVYIVSNNIDGNPTGVVLHEVGVHYGMRGVLGKDFAPILERFKSLRQSNNKVRAAYDSVPQDTQNANLDEEALAYYVEDNWGAKVPLMQRIVNAFKVFANRLGIPLSKLNASPELLVQIAKGATKKAADGLVRFNGGDTMRSTTKSKGLPPTINIDGIERSTTNSNGKPIAETEEGVRNFWKWFGDSKVVDADGRPLVVYHGTKANSNGDAFEFFGTYASNYGLMGMGAYFTEDPQIASSYTTKGGGRTPTVYPVYLSIKNPMDMDANANESLWRQRLAKEFPLDVDRPTPERNSTNEDWYRNVERALISSEVDMYDGAEQMQYMLRGMGFDGITHIGGGRIKSDGTRHRVYVAFEPDQIKSATGNSGAFSSADPSILKSKRRSKVDDAKDNFYSALIRGVESLPMNAATPAGWKSTIVGLTNKGVAKVDEVEWSGINEWLDLQQGKVTKDQIIEYLDGNGVKVEEVVLSDDTTSGTKYRQLTLPGGENYKELLLTLPTAGSGGNRVRVYTSDGLSAVQVMTDDQITQMRESGRRRFEVLNRVNPAKTFQSSHFDQPNILAHVRFNERTDAVGKRILFIEEIQSDWGQTLKKYKDQNTTDLETALRQVEKNPPPIAPFVTATDKWLALALKRMIKLAVDGGYDKIAFVTGEQSSGRYDLSKQVDKITVPMVNASGTRSVRIDPTGGTSIKLMVDTKGIADGIGYGSTQFTGKTLDQIIGKEIADRVMQAEAGAVFEGDGLKVGGEGMKAFYDKIVPNVAKEVLKKIGGIGVINVDIGGGLVNQIGFDVTDNMRNNVVGGLPLFSKRRTIVEERVKAEARKQQVGAEMGVYDPKSATAPAMWDWSDNTIDKTIGLRGKINKLREHAQDRMLVFRDARDDIEGQIAVLNEAADVYTLENLASGKAGHRIDELTNKYWNPLVGKMKEINVSVSLLEDYAEAMHAGERNEAVARKNPGMQDSGSGMTTAEAKDFLDGKAKGLRSGEVLDVAKSKNLASLMDIVKKVTADTRKNLLESGVIDQGTYDALENKYKEYVPLRGKDGVENGAGRIGVGVNRVRNPIKRALGRGDGNRASNIIGEVFSDAQRSIIISEKAKVDQALLRMALQYPNSNVYEVEPVKVEQKYSEAAQEVYQGIKNIDNEPGTVIVPYKGRKYRVLLKDERMANAYNKLSAEQLNKIVSVLGVANRWFSAVLTRYNPAFIATNLVRDLGMGVPAIIAEHGLDAGVKLLKNYPKAMQAMVQQLRGKDPSNYHQKMAKEFSAEGGKTYFALADMPADAQGRMEYELQTVFGLISEGKPFRAVKKAFDKLKIAQAVESANEVIENTLRLSAYITLREKGISKQKAAQYAKDFTVNFSRRGQSTSALNAIWLFFNASVQGGHRTMKLIKDNPKMLVYLGSLAAMQGGLAWMAKGMEDDEGKNLWDQIPSWEKQRNLIIPYFATVDGKKQARYFKVPVPYGFNLFSYMGGRVADLSNDMANDRDVDGKEFMGDMAAGISGAFSPLPLEAQGWRAVLPYYVNVGLALSTNKDDLGRRITQEQPYAKYEMPRTAYGRSDTPIVFKAISKGLNRLGGGDDFTKPTAPALLDWSPEDLQYLAEKFAGGLGSTAVKTVNMAESLIAGVPLSPREVPIASSFFSSSDARSSNASEYYDNRDKLERDIARIRTSVRNGKGRDVDTEVLDPAALKIRVGKSGAVTITGGSLLSSYRKTERDIAKVKDEIAAVNSSDISSIAKKLRVLQLQNRRSELQERFNRQWRLLNRTR